MQVSTIHRAPLLPADKIGRGRDGAPNTEKISVGVEEGVVLLAFGYQRLSDVLTTIEDCYCHTEYTPGVN